MKHEINFINATKEDIESFLGPIENDDGPFVTIEPEWVTLAHLMHHAKLFNSVGDARRNGWNKPIPKGFSKFVVGKKKMSVFVLNLI